MLPSVCFHFVVCCIDVMRVISLMTTCVVTTYTVTISSELGQRITGHCLSCSVYPIEQIAFFVVKSILVKYSCFVVKLIEHIC